MGGFDNISPAVQISIGILVGILSTSVQSLGLTLQRKSHLLEDGRPAHVQRRPPHRRGMWQIGMLLFIVANIFGSTVQITTLPLVILSPLQASGLVFNSICATLILAEPFTRLSLVGTVLVCLGATLIATFGAMKEPAHSLDELLGLLAGVPFLVWMGGQAIIVFGILIATKMSSVMRPKQVHTPKMKMIRGVAYGCVSGILSADCLLLAKSAVELLVRTIVDRVNQFNRWQSWMILLGLVTLALTQLYYLHRGLKLCSTSVLYPLVFCVYNIIAILDGLIYYKQASRLSVLHACLIALGTAILLSGVLALSWRLSEEMPAGAQQTTQSALSPGIGLLEHPNPLTDSEDNSDDGNDGDAILSHNGDDDDDDGLMATETTGLIRRASARETTNTPARPSPRRRTMTEVEEIWGELEDDGTSNSTAGGLLKRSQSSLLSKHTRHPLHHSLHQHRRSRSSRDEELGGDLNESSSLLGRGGSFFRRPGGGKRSSYLFPTSSTGTTVEGNSGSSRRRSSGEGAAARGIPNLQDAIGGWWPMKWWKKEYDSEGGGEGIERGSESGSGSGGLIGSPSPPPPPPPATRPQLQPLPQIQPLPPTLPPTPPIPPQPPSSV
ncbi:magnesium transporter NIPA-domain-containing protein [Peziza echinospora]|nr:magnesium transporter NIPA-domain-containing protein [Peziza echinospora]